MTEGIYVLAFMLAGGLVARGSVRSETRKERVLWITAGIAVAVAALLADLS